MVHRWPLRSVSCFIKFMQASRGMVNLQEKKKKKKKGVGGWIYRENSRKIHFFKWISKTSLSSSEDVLIRD